jgi:hypothetical protein
MGVPGGTEAMEQALALARLRALEEYERECVAVERRRLIVAVALGVLIGVALTRLFTGGSTTCADSSFSRSPP